MPFNASHSLPNRLLPYPTPDCHCSIQPGTILPFATCDMILRFQSNSSGVFSEDWQLISTPQVTGTHPILSLCGVTESVEDFSKTARPFKVGHTHTHTHARTQVHVLRRVLNANCLLSCGCQRACQCDCIHVCGQVGVEKRQLEAMVRGMLHHVITNLAPRPRPPTPEERWRRDKDTFIANNPGLCVRAQHANHVFVATPLCLSACPLPLV